MALCTPCKNLLLTVYKTCVLNPNVEVERTPYMLALSGNANETRKYKSIPRDPLYFIRNKLNCWFCCRICMMFNVNTEEIVETLARDPNSEITVSNKHRLWYLRYISPEVDAYEDHDNPGGPLMDHCLRFHADGNFMPLFFRKADAPSTHSGPVHTYRITHSQGQLGRGESLSGSGIEQIELVEQPIQGTKSKAASDLDGRSHQIRQWINTCCSEHTQCRASSVASTSLGRDQLPKRLIKVGSNDDETALVLSKSLDKTELIQYATLSHCWGKETFLTLTPQNYDQFLERIPVSTLAKTFRQTIQLCRLIGIPYLWIDCFCIIQNSPNDSDFREEAVRMHHIYGNSTLTIASTFSTSPETGLFRPYNGLSIDGLQFLLPDGRVLTDREDLEIINLGSYCQAGPLLRRGWVAQEMALSTRTLHWTDTQLLWQCKTGFIIESLDRMELVPGFLHASVDFSTALSSSDLDEKWLEVAKMYAKSKVTLPLDRYYALSGLATRFQQAYQDLGIQTQYLAGCWEHNIFDLLCWSVGFHEGVEHVHTYTPSWSWLQYQNLVIHYRYIGVDAARWHCFAKLINTDIAYQEEAGLFGPLKSASLQIEAPVFEFVNRGFLGHVYTYVPPESSSVYFRSSKGSRVHLSGEHSMRCVTCNLNPGEEIRDGVAFKCALVTGDSRYWSDPPPESDKASSEEHQNENFSLTAIILKAAKDVSPDTYRRVGVLRVNFARKSEPRYTGLRKFFDHRNFDMKTFNFV